MSDQALTTIESRGLTVEAAIAAGLAEMGLTRDDVNITVIDEGSRGLLGIGSRDAVVRLVKKLPQEPPAPEPTPVLTPPVRMEEKAVESEEVEPYNVTVAPVAARPTEAVETDETDDDQLSAEREAAVELISELLEKMRVPAAVTAYLSDVDDATGRPVNIVDISGEDLGLLIGARGETLEALQFVSRLMVAHRLHRRANFVVDVEGYRQRRQQALVKLAERMAAKVQERQQPVSLEPMPPYERRVIHMTLRDSPYVYTESAGEGNQRKVRIYPKN